MDYVSKINLFENTVYIKDEEARKKLAETAGKVVTVESFGAVGDGVTDDSEAFSNAIKYANDNGYKIICTKPAYKLSAVSEPVNCSIDFGGASIITPVPATNDSIVFQVGKISDTISASASEFTRCNTTNRNLLGKTFTVETGIVLGQRGGTGATMTRKQLMACAKDGTFINTPFYTNTTGSFTILNPRPIDETPITIENAKLAVTAGAFSYCFFSTSRNNVTYKNFVVTGATSNNDWNTAVFNNVNCYNITYKNIIGANPNGPGSGYIIGSADAISDLTVINCKMFDKNGTSWGSIGLATCSNFRAVNSYSNRFDCHYEFFGDYRLTGCVLKYAKFCAGIGNIIYEDCQFIAKDTYAIIQNRDDFPVYVTGNIIIKNCIFNSTRTSRFAIASYSNNRESENFESLGYGATNIIVQNIIVKATSTYRLIDLYTNVAVFNIVGYGAPNDDIIKRYNDAFITKLVFDCTYIGWSQDFACAKTLICNNVTIDGATFSNMQNAILTGCLIEEFALEPQAVNLSITGCIVPNNRTISTNNCIHAAFFGNAAESPTWNNVVK